ncbi:MAG: glutaredoxin family protein [Gammaproteobacteria bacterium]|nr:glutaredoxin family protein [Gammaproteobacteria bacterium]
MINANTIEFLTTQGCSLCDQALDLLICMPEMAGLSLVTVDIADSNELLDKFAERIPVLRRGEHLICWPFDHQAVSAWLSQSKRGEF